MPPELRNTIYRFALVRNVPIRVAPKQGWVDSHPALTPTLFQVCRQIRHEARLIFWSETVFQMNSVTSLKAFVKWLRDVDRALLMSMRTIRPVGFRVEDLDLLHAKLEKAKKYMPAGWSGVMEVEVVDGDGPLWTQEPLKYKGVYWGA